MNILGGKLEKKLTRESWFTNLVQKRFQQSSNLHLTKISVEQTNNRPTSIRVTIKTIDQRRFTDNVQTHGVSEEFYRVNRCTDRSVQMFLSVSFTLLNQEASGLYFLTRHLYFIWNTAMTIRPIDKRELD